jgi:hypothetical protein
MLKSTLLISFLWVQAFCFGQTYNQIVFDQVKINNVRLGSNKNDLLQKIGKPNKITKYVSDANDDSWYQYYYKNAILEVSLKKDFIGFEIRSRDFILTCTGSKIKIGDSVSVLKKPFPESYKMYLKEKGKFRLKFKDSDSFLIIEIKNGIINKIRTWDEL